MNNFPNETAISIMAALDLAAERVIANEQNIEPRYTFIFAFGLTVAFMLYSTYYYVTQTGEDKCPPSSSIFSRTQKDFAKDAEAQAMARRAAMERQEKARVVEKERTARKRAARAKAIEKQQQALMLHKAVKPSSTAAEMYCQPVFPKESNHGPTFSVTNATNQNAVTPHVGPIYEFGITRYYHVPHLPKADKTKEMLTRIAKEFEPILTRRGYQVYTVSEMCCCGDGLDTGELAGHRRRVQAGQTINGAEQHQCGGYNRTVYRGRGKTRHSIHLRMRHPKNHSIVRSYAELVTTMCHELAHCEQQNHSDKFYDLMDEIKQEYVRLISGAAPLEAYAESNNGFDIYQASTGAWRST